MTAEELRALTELLERLSSDPSPLFELSEDERVRLRTAAGALCNPDVEARRQYFRHRNREESKATIARD